MRVLVAITMSAVLVSCATARPNGLPNPCIAAPVNLAQPPQLGERVPDAGPTCIHTIAGASQTWPSYTATVDGIEWTIGLDDRQTIRYIFTTDAAFRSPEQLRIRDSVARVLEVAPGQSVVRETGWGDYVRLPSGWLAFVDRGRVLMFFKRS